MATKLNYIEFVMEQIDTPFAKRYQKMFGEYMVYVNEKPILLVCDDTVFVKILPETTTLLKQAHKGLPYPSAKEHYILDIENQKLVNQVVTILEQITKHKKK